MQRLRYLFLAAFVVLCHALLFAASCQVHAEEPFTRTEVLVARLVVHESGFASSDDPRAITHVVRERAARLHMRIATYVETYHARATFGPTNRPWVNGLDGTLAAPAGWPHDNVSWRWGRKRWLQRLHEVRTALRREDNACPAYTWGSPTYIAERIERMVSNGWQRVNCGDTLNVYLQTPPGRRQP